MLHTGSIDSIYCFKNKGCNKPCDDWHMILTNTLLGTIRIHRIKWPRNEYELIEEKESRAGPGGRAGPQLSRSRTNAAGIDTVAFSTWLLQMQEHCGTNFVQLTSPHQCSSITAVFAQAQRHRFPVNIWWCFRSCVIIQCKGFSGRSRKMMRMLPWPRVSIAMFQMGWSSICRVLVQG